MNKQKVNELIPRAYIALKNVGIAKANGQIDKKWRSQISAFGASVMQGSLVAAVSFFSKQSGADVDRELLMDAIAALIDSNYTKLFDYACNSNVCDAKENIVNATIALKLAMNLYDMKEDVIRGDS